MAWTHTTGRPQVMLYSLIFLLVLGMGTALGGAGDTPRQGGTLRVVTISGWSALDPYVAGVGITRLIANHYLEGLYTIGKDYGMIPMLAEGHTVSNDGRVYTFKLRRGVPFHNGKELTTADVVPSLWRWGKMHPHGKELFKRLESLQPLDKYTVQMRFTEKSALVLPLLGPIYPKEVLDEAGEGEVKTFIGTGPFKVAEHQAGRPLTLVRFAQYQARPEPPNGHGGGKTAWVDTLRFLHIPNSSARVAALESGEADFLLNLPPVVDAYDRVKAHPDLKMLLVQDYDRIVTVLNKRHGLFTNVKLRQAFLAALDMDAILRTIFWRPELYRLDASLAPRASPWWTDVGREQYNQPDQDKARRLLHEAGYQGQPIRYVTPSLATVPGTYKHVLATKQHLEAVGFNVELQVMTEEWGTFLGHGYNNPDLWDAYTTTSGEPIDPTLDPLIRCDGLGWNCDPDFEQLLHAMATELQFEKRYRLWQDLQRLFWERVPVIHYGFRTGMQVMRKHVHGPFDMPQAYFWNVWVEK